MAASSSHTLALVLAVLAVLAASPVAAAGGPGRCKPVCYPWRKWDPVECPWKYCAHKNCWYKTKKGKWRKGFRCTARTPAPPPKPAPSASASPPPKGPPSTCPNKCYLKWRDAKDTCNVSLCQIKGCPIWVSGRKKWGFRCIAQKSAKPTPSASPSPSPSPKEQYPSFCPLKCRRWKGAVTALCNPAKCVVKRCENPRKKWKFGFNCVPIPPTPPPSPSASASASPSPAVKPKPPAFFCEQRCRRNRWRVVRRCDLRYCQVKGCKNPLRWWKFGYVCSPKEAKPTPSASPSPSPAPKPAACGNKCLWSKRRWQVQQICDPTKCKIVRCWPWRALKCVEK